MELVKQTSAIPSSISPRKISASLPVPISSMHGTDNSISAIQAPMIIGRRPSRSLNSPPTTLSGIITSITMMISSSPLVSA